MTDDSFGASSKSILRQSRLQFASALKQSSSLTAHTSSHTTNKESLFTSSVTNNNLNRNSIQCKHRNKSIRSNSYVSFIQTPKKSKNYAFMNVEN